MWYACGESQRDTAGAYLHAMARHPTERGPILTEDAWQEIETVTDLPTLRLLCAMMFACSNTATAHLFTRLFLEDSRFRQVPVSAMIRSC